jgi:hypothetical protein
VFVSDLRHFLDLPDDVSGPARRMAEHLSLIVRAATAGDSGTTWVTALSCNRRPGRVACAGTLAVRRTDVPPTIAWQCTSCGDDGVISGWERSPYDLRPRSSEARATDGTQVVVSAEVAGTLRSLMLLDSTSERLLFRARVVEGVIILTGDEDELDELLGYVAAEANHEENRRRQKRLDAAFAALDDALRSPGGRAGMH